MKKIILLLSWKGKIVMSMPLEWYGHDLSSFLREAEAKYPSGATLSWISEENASERVIEKLLHLWRISSAMGSSKFFGDEINRLDILAELSSIRSFV